jgi:tRNA(Ile)-lysidine synthase TilS/MesJ
MRRGALHDAAKELGCNKAALGHHADDAVETFMMNLIFEGRIGCFSPVTYLSRKDITVIRPLIYAYEDDIASQVRKAGLPVVKSICPADGNTSREWSKKFISGLEYSHRASRIGYSAP